MTNFYYSIPISFLLFSAQVSTADLPNNNDNLNVQREQAVLDVRNGHGNEGLLKLNKLLKENPNNQRILADYIVVSKQQNTFDQSDLNLINQIDYKTYPQYAQLATIKAFRDLKQFSSALVLVDGFSKTTPDLQLDVLKAVLLAENQQQQKAIEQLSKINIQKLTPDQQVQVAYTYRVLGVPIKGLSTIQYAYEAKPDSVAVQQEYILALMANGSYQQVLAIVQNNKSIDQNSTFYQQAYIGDFSQKINEAIKNQKYLSNQGETENESFVMLDSVLANAQPFKKQLTPTSESYIPFYNNYIYALSYRGRDQEVIELINTLGFDTNKMPAYVRHAVADSYLAVKKPKQAEKIYKTLLKEKNYPDMSLYSSLYYALIDQEKYTEAQKLIKDVDKLIPTFQYSLAKGAERRVHPDRAEYIGFKEVTSAYGNQLNVAEKNLNAIVAKAPNNEEYTNSLARIQRWRDKPQQSQQTLNRLNGLKPESKTTKINKMQNAQALGDIESWRLLTQNLNMYYPTDSSIIKSLKELDDRNHATISHETRLSKSEAKQDQVLESLKGSRDYETTTRINSPWIKDHYRVITEYTNREGQYRSGDIDEQRLGVGAQWEANRKSATVMLSQDLDNSDRTGVRLDWDHQLNDHWQYSLDFNSQAAIPLQAFRLGEKGKSYGAGINWKQNESRSLGLGYQVTDITDGNLRQEVSANYNQNIFIRPHHTTRAGLSAYYGNNSLDQTSYFSPENSSSFGVNLSHDWLTWRSYERSMTQKFLVSAGVYKQSDFGSKPVFDVQYQHKWQLSRLWGLHYGIGWAKHPYDGQDEEQVYGNLGFEGRF